MMRVMMRMLAAVIFSAAVLMTSPMASAQKAPVDPARLAAAKELLAASGSAQQLDAVMPTMLGQMALIFGNQKPQHKGEIDKVFQSLASKFTARKQELIDLVAELYAETFSADDLKGLLAFFKTPLGAKFVGAQPQLLQQQMVAGQRWGMKIGQEVEAEVRQELKKRGIEL
jgi:uncharacterized protein